MCQNCGNVWRSEPAEVAVKGIGLFVGDWDDEEIAKVQTMVNIVPRMSGSADWHFVKGRASWAVYRDWWPAHKVVSTSKLEDLMYWATASVTDPRWLRQYLNFLG
jgi:hypothetical protein